MPDASRPRRALFQLVAGGAAVALAASSCGVRVSSSLRERAAAAQLGGVSAGGGGGGGAGSSLGSSGGLGTGSAGSAAAVIGGSGAGSGGSSTGSGGSATGGAGGGSASAAGGAGAGGASASGGGAAGGGGGAPAPAGGNGGATDVGVTATSITLGNVSDLSGPVPGLFQGAATGTLAYFNYINSQGGIFGRQLKLATADSQTSCNQTQQAYQSLIPKVFAFVGSFGLYDNCAASVLGQNSNIPAVQYMLSANAIALPNDFSVNPLTGGYPNGMFLYWTQKFGPAVVQNVGTLYANIPSAVAQATSIDNVAQSSGWKITYQRAVGATETNYTADIIRMQSSNVKLIFVVGGTAQMSATIVQEAEQQNWHPIFVMPVAYAQNFIDLVGGASAAEGVWGSSLYTLFFSPSDAQNIPEVALYQQWMKRTDPNQPEDLYSMYAWAESALFVQALKAAGAKASRAALLAALKQVTSFNDNGLVGPANPAGKVATHCYVLWQIHGGQFVRVDTPGNNYRCDGAFTKG